ncbi:hypothetical protein RX121_004486 [Salmonella enterica]|nr:hypothetical protein [Salmonella enterica subsp. enterica serovar Anatum]ELL7958902.1 hypothetical protein [Salmonella enterica]HAW3293903.1 hypothetical protein [Escherichia coli]ELR0288249.1 hypothetical protein [Salmonella enterica]ELR0452927.1 hypothetical protein [Salmonella enterica]
MTEIMAVGLLIFANIVFWGAFVGVLNLDTLSERDQQFVSDWLDNHGQQVVRVIVWVMMVITIGLAVFIFFP